VSRPLSRNRNESGAVEAPETNRSGTPAHLETPAEPDRAPNGSLAAALVSAGLACAVFGLLVMVSERFEALGEGALVMSEGVGALSGKAVVATVVYLAVWVVLHRRVGRRTVDLAGWLRATGILVAVGLLATFPPVFQLFASH
jgi:hypothetical protein